MTEKERKYLSNAMKHPYPMNLMLTAILDPYGSLIIEKNKIDDDHIAGLLYAMSMLPERTQTMIKMRFIDQRTYEEIGKAYGFTLVRSRTLIQDGISKLRRPPLIGYLKYGKEAYELMLKQLAEEREKKIENPLQTSIIDAGLPVKVINRLTALGYDSLADIAKMDQTAIERINQFGDISRRAVADYLHSIGITGTAWDRYK